MTTEPVAPPKKPSAPPTKDIVDDLADKLFALTAEQRQRLQDKTSLQVPETYVGIDLSVRKFGYRCKGCGCVALEFLGEKEPPVGVSFEHLAFVQDGDDYGSKPDWRRQQRKGKPRCMHCNRMIATEPGTNGIMDNRLIRDIAQYRSERKASEQQAFWAHRRPNYRRDMAAGMGRP